MIHCPHCNGVDITADVNVGNLAFKQRGSQWEFDDENVEIESCVTSQLDANTYMVCSTCHTEWNYSHGFPIRTYTTPSDMA